MLREGQPIGVIIVARREPVPFTERQVELRKTFAAQAVIAIKNVRLFTELETRNRDLTATSEILPVISSSPSDVQPVFATILDHATRLCEAQRGIRFRCDGEAYHAAAFRGVEPALVEHHRRAPIRPGPHTALTRIRKELRPVHIDDVLADAAFGESDPRRRADRGPATHRAKPGR
jgi:GAF domain-containing protein